MCLRACKIQWVTNFTLLKTHAFRSLDWETLHLVKFRQTNQNSDAVIRKYHPGLKKLQWTAESSRAQTVFFIYIQYIQYIFSFALAGKVYIDEREGAVSKNGVKKEHLL